MFCEKKQSLFLFCFLLSAVILLPFLPAFSMKFDKPYYVKGNDLNVFGECAPGSEVSLSAATGENNFVFSEILGCGMDGKYWFAREISFLDPSGDWVVSAKSGSEEEKSRIVVAQNRESSFYLVTFTSPVVEKIGRTSGINVTVKITDSGESVYDANVATWLLSGERVFLRNEGGGIYIMESVIPYDYALGKKDIVVTAESRQGGKVFGGEASTTIDIEKAVIDVNLLEPKARNFDLTSRVNFEVAATYPDGKAIEKIALKPIAILQHADSNIPFIENGNGRHVLSYTPLPSDSGNTSFTILVFDDAGNSGSESLNITFSCSPVCLVQTYDLFFLILLLITLPVLVLAGMKARKLFGERSTRDEKEKLEELVKELQEDYFKKAKITPSLYRKTLAEYKARIAELEQKGNVSAASKKTENFGNENREKENLENDGKEKK